MEEASPETACPHCGASVSPELAFCEQCGKALPTASDRPRIVEGASFAATAVGQKLQADELRRKAKSSSGALLAVAIFATLGCGLVYMVLQDAFDDPEVGGAAKAMMAAQVVLTVAYYGLYIWSRTNPLPAAIIGLVVYLSLMAVNAIIFGPQTLAEGIIVKVIIVVFLLKAIQAGVQHRELLHQMASE